MADDSDDDLVQRIAAATCAEGFHPQLRDRHIARIVQDIHRRKNAGQFGAPGGKGTGVVHHDVTGNGRIPD